MKVRELAITGLEYKLAQALPDGSIKHYVFPQSVFEMAMLGRNIREEAIKRLEAKFGESVEIEPVLQREPSEVATNGIFQTEDVTSKLTESAQLALSRRCKNAILEYLEERPTKPGFLRKLERSAKKLILGLAYKTIYKNPINYAAHLVHLKFDLPTNKIHRLLDQWKLEIFVHRISALSCLAVRATESSLQSAYDEISHLVDCTLGAEVIKGCLGVYKIGLADVVGDGQRRYVVWCGVFLPSAMSAMLNIALESKDHKDELERNYYLLREGSYPSRSVDLDPVIIEERL